MFSYFLFSVGLSFTHACFLYSQSLFFFFVLFCCLFNIYILCFSLPADACLRLYYVLACLHIYPRFSLPQTGNMTPCSAVSLVCQHVSPCLNSLIRLLLFIISTASFSLFWMKKAILAYCLLDFAVVGSTSLPISFGYKKIHYDRPVIRMRLRMLMGRVAMCVCRCVCVLVTYSTTIAFLRVAMLMCGWCVFVCTRLHLFMNDLLVR